MSSLVFVVDRQVATNAAVEISALLERAHNFLIVIIVTTNLKAIKRPFTFQLEFQSNLQRTWLFLNSFGAKTVNSEASLRSCRREEEIFLFLRLQTTS